MASDDEDELAALRAARAARTGQATLVTQLLLLQLLHVRTSREKHSRQASSIPKCFDYFVQSDLRRRAGTAEDTAAVARWAQQTSRGSALGHRYHCI